MNFQPLELDGAYLVDLSTQVDDRGFFARSFCAAEFGELGLMASVAQCNVSYNVCRGTLRGLHYQASPHEEAKLVRCTRGSIWDVIVDLRADSQTYLAWFGAELTAENHRAMYVPEGFAHGFITLSDEAEVFYLMSEYYTPGSGRGARWDDPVFGIEWPIEPMVMSENDRHYPDYRST